MSEIGTKAPQSPEGERISSNASTLIDIGKGKKLDLFGLKNYLDSLKKQQKLHHTQQLGSLQPPTSEIQPDRLSPKQSESLLKKFSQSSIGPPQYLSLEDNSFRGEEEIHQDIKNIDNFLVANQ